jgi:histidinol dehydrogenase
MRKISFPKKTSWNRLCERPAMSLESMEAIVKEVFIEVRLNGDKAVQQFTEKFDNKKLTKLTYSLKEKNLALDPTLEAAIDLAYDNIYTFHAAQKRTYEKIQTTKGVICWQEDRAIERVGLYIPGGSAPLFSTVLMLAIPAQIAGCTELVLCTPPDQKGKIPLSIQYAAQKCGVDKIYCVGGIQAIAGMTFGTKSIPKVDKIFGPGNAFVMAAKSFAQQLGVAIDMPAGPSELLIIADEKANVSFAAADLLSQAEHGEDSQVVLLTTNNDWAERLIQEVNRQVSSLPRKVIAQQALKKSMVILFEEIKECIEFSNEYAPEHLILATENARELTKEIKNAGSVFIGAFSCESAGDYASGTNHTLPTSGAAKAYSGVNLSSFQKQITFQDISAQGILTIGPAIERMAEAEDLEAHKRAVSYRLNTLKA